MERLSQIFCSIYPWLPNIIVSVITALIVLFINNKLLFLGRVRIDSLFTICYIVATKPSESKEYVISCKCFNNKSIPVYLNNFHIEMKVSGSKKPRIIQVSNPVLDIHRIGGVVMSTPSPVAAQIIPPRVFHEFSLKLNSDGEIASISKLKLVCNNEKNKRLSFNICNGVIK